MLGYSIGGENTTTVIFGRFWISRQFATHESIPDETWTSQPVGSARYVEPLATGLLPSNVATMSHSSVELRKFPIQGNRW